MSGRTSEVSCPRLHSIQGAERGPRLALRFAPTRSLWGPWKPCGTGAPPPHTKGPRDVKSVQVDGGAACGAAQVRGRDVPPDDVGAEDPFTRCDAKGGAHRRSEGAWPARPVVSKDGMLGGICTTTAGVRFVPTSCADGGPPPNPSVRLWRVPRLHEACGLHRGTAASTLQPASLQAPADPPCHDAAARRDCPLQPSFA